jgi:hypothetical protein
MKIFSVIAVFLSSDNRKQIVFLHNAKHSLWILMDSLPFKPYMHSAVTVGAMAMLLTLSDLLGKRQIPCRYIHSFDIVIVATS